MWLLHYIPKWSSKWHIQLLFFQKFTDLFNPCTVAVFHPADEEGPESDDEEEEDDNDVSW